MKPVQRGRPETFPPVLREHATFRQVDHLATNGLLPSMKKNPLGGTRARDFSRVTPREVIAARFILKLGGIVSPAVLKWNGVQTRGDLVRMMIGNEHISIDGVLVRLPVEAESPGRAA